MRSIPVAILIVIGVVALVAGTAYGTPAASRPTLFTTPFVYKGYSWTMYVQDGAPDTLTIIATKRAGQAVQSHLYSFQQGVSFTANAKLSSAKLKANLGPFGTIAMTFISTGALAKSSPPPPCRGATFQNRAGTLAGKPGLSFQVGTSFFGKLSKPSLKARLSKQVGTGTLDCGAGGGPATKPPAGGISLVGFAAEGQGVTISVTRTAAGAVTQSAVLLEQKAPASAVHSITAPAPASSFTVADDLSSATVTGQGPFLGGTLSFEGVGFGGQAAGELSGDFTVRFDAPGPLKPAADGTMQGVLTRS